MMNNTNPEIEKAIQAIADKMIEELLKELPKGKKVVKIELQ